MKKFMMMMVAVIAMTACNNESKKEDVTTDGKVLTSINFGGDVSFKEEALTRAVKSGNTYVAIQIDSFRYNPYLRDTTYYRVTEGVFSYTEGLSVALDKSKTYKVRAAIILDGADKFYTKNNLVYRPLSYRGGSAEITNSFTKTYNVEVNDAQYFTVVNQYDKATELYNPSLNYYIGSCIIKGGDRIDLSMMRKNFGIRFTLTPPSEGTLKVYNSKEPHFDYTLTSSSEKVDEVKMFALPYNISEKLVKFNIEYTDASGKVYDYSTEKTLKNKTITTLNVNIKTNNNTNPDTPNESAESGISIVYDEGMSFEEEINVE